MNIINSINLAFWLVATSAITSCALYRDSIRSLEPATALVIGLGLIFVMGIIVGIVLTVIARHVIARRSRPAPAVDHAR